MRRWGRPRTSNCESRDAESTDDHAVQTPERPAGQRMRRWGRPRISNCNSSDATSTDARAAQTPSTPPSPPALPRPDRRRVVEQPVLFVLLAQPGELGIERVLVRQKCLLRWRIGGLVLEVYLRQATSWGGARA